MYPHLTEDGEVPLTRSEHVNHVIEAHRAIFSTLEISWCPKLLGNVNVRQDDQLFVNAGEECLAKYIYWRSPCHERNRQT